MEYIVCLDGCEHCEDYITVYDYYNHGVPFVLREFIITHAIRVYLSIVSLRCA